MIGSRLGLAVTGSIPQPMYPMTCGGSLILRSAKGGFALLMKRDEGEATNRPKTMMAVHRVNRIVVRVHRENRAHTSLIRRVMVNQVKPKTNTLLSNPLM